MLRSGLHLRKLQMSRQRKRLQINLHPDPKIRLHGAECLAAVRCHAILAVGVGAPADGRIRVTPEAHLHDRSQEHYFQETWGMDPNQIYISPLEPKVEHGKIPENYLRGSTCFA